MAANYWLSTHSQHWTRRFTRKQLDLVNASVPDFTAPEIQMLHGYFAEYIQRVCNRLRFRQRVTATAIVYFKRFFLRHSFVGFNAWLVAVTCIYTAAKAEESAVRLSDLIAIVQAKFKDMGHVSSFTQSLVLQCEFVLLEALEFDLVVFHPYRPLQLYLDDVGLQEECMQTAWSILNDAYHDDVVLLYPPYMMALAAIHMACTYVKRDVTDWFDKLTIDHADIEVITKCLLTLYKQHAAAGYRDSQAAVVLRMHKLAPQGLEVDNSDAEARAANAMCDVMAKLDHPGGSSKASKASDSNTTTASASSALPAAATASASATASTASASARKPPA